MSNSHIAKAYLKIGCPYSFKFLMFMSETGLTDQIEIVGCDPAEAEAYDQLKESIKAKTGVPMTFPTVEIEPDVYLADSEGLIDYYAAKNGISDTNPPILAFYRESIYTTMINRKQELFELKQQLAAV
ncbi:MAG: hypothetical protein AAF614_00930 [Chloroflexota bacterium]